MKDSNQLFNSYLWQLISKWTARSLGIISTLILVRILTPADFGLAAQSMMVIMFFQALSQTGTNQFIIKMKTVSTSQLMSAWTLNLLVRTFSAFVVFFFSSSIAEFIGDPRLIDVLKVACLVPIIGNFLSPGIILLQKNMRFKKLSLIEITSKCVSFAVTISLAYLFRDYWALIWGNVSAVITTVFVSYFIAPKTPSLTLKHIKEQWHFTKGIFLSSVLGYLRAKADIFIVSKKFGSESVGHYSIAQEFSSLPLTEVISPMMSPLFSSFAKIADQQQLLEEKVFKYLSLTYLFLFPCVTGMVFLSAEIVEILLGKQWSSAAPVLANLSFLMVVFITNGTLKHIFTLRSLFKGVIIIDILGLILIACALLIDHIDAIASFSQYRAFIGIIIIISTAIIAKIMLRFKLLPFLIISIVPFGCSFLMWCALSISSVYTEILMNLYLETLALIFIGAISYLALAYSAIHLLKNKSTIWHFNHSFVTSSMMSITKKLKNVIK